MTVTELRERMVAYTKDSTEYGTLCGPDQFARAKASQILEWFDSYATQCLVVRAQGEALCKEILSLGDTLTRRAEELLTIRCLVALSLDIFKADVAKAGQRLATGIEGISWPIFEQALNCNMTPKTENIKTVGVNGHALIVETQQ